MKKIIRSNCLLIVIIVGLFALNFFRSIFSRQVFAQQWDNKFSCEWTGINCVPATSSFPSGCAPGFEPDKSVCESITDTGQCFGSFNNDCIDITLPGTTYMCQGSFGGCTPVPPGSPPGPYSTFDECNTACTFGAQNYRCDPNLGCVVDLAGAFGSALACEVSGCTAGPGPTIPVYDPECTTDNGQEGVKSALGCLPVGPQAFVFRVLPWSVFLGAGIAFLLGVLGAMMIVLSAGNPEKMQAGKEMITSAIGGLVLIVSAVFLLELIGVKILKLFTL